MITLRESIIGSLLGTAAGDLLGLPFEGMHRKRIKRFSPNFATPQLLFNKGMVSDDTEHSAFVAASLLQNSTDPEEFSRHLQHYLRYWILGFPGGIGKATLVACLKLLIGVSPKKSGVFSAGNAPAMRSAIFGAAAISCDQYFPQLEISTRMTHTDPLALAGARAVALAAWCSKNEITDAQAFLEIIQQFAQPEERKFTDAIIDMVTSLRGNESSADFARAMGWKRGINPYVCYSVPFAIHAWLSHPNNLQNAIIRCIRCGGDTDTTAAICGGIMGAGLGKEAIPELWLSQSLEWPRSIRWLEELANALADSLENKTPAQVPSYFWPAIPARNALFLTVVLLHAVRRLLPPY